MKNTSAYFVRELLLAIMLGTLMLALPAHTGNRISGDAGADTTAGHDFYYTCPMHPSVHEAAPGACPVCGMTLVKKFLNRQTAGSPVPAGVLRLDDAQRVLAGVGTSPAQRRALVRTLTLPGTLSYQEALRHGVTARFAGRIESLFVTSAGAHVKPGDRLYSVFSPDLLTALEEYRTATAASLRNADAPDIISAPSAAIAAEAKRKLLFLGLNEEQISEFIADSARSVITVRSDFGGTILSMNVRQQQYVAAGDLLFDLAGTDPLWLDIRVPEEDAPFVRTGQKVDARVEGNASRPLRGSIDFISRQIDADSRTLLCRATVPNGKGLFRAGEFAEVALSVQLPPAVVVPVTAVVTRDGSSCVWIEGGRNEYVPRTVSIGASDGKSVQIIGGVAEGERVVVSGGYLLDSESRLRFSDTLSAGH